MATRDGSVTLIEDVHAKGFWYLYATWTVDGHESILRLRFRSRPPDWYLDTIDWAISDPVMPDGRRAMGSFAGDARDLTRAPPGRPFNGRPPRTDTAGVTPLR